jgi:hypothetical protein
MFGTASGGGTDLRKPNSRENSHRATDPDTTQTWLLVRLKQPEMPNAPQSTSDEPKET